MINIKFFEKQHRFAIATTGHANYAPYGQDIVCAAVSSLVQTYGNFIVDHEKFRTWKVLEVKLNEGDTNVEVVDPKDSIKDLYYMIMEGLEDIKRAYPGYITIEYNPKNL